MSKSWLAAKRNRQRLLEIRARDDRRAKLAAQQGIDPEELKRREEEAAAARKAQMEGEDPPAAKPEKKQEKKPAKKPVAKSSSGKGKGMISFEESADEDDVF